MSKIFSKLNQLNRGYQKVTVGTMGILTWIWAYDRYHDYKRSKIVVSKKNIELVEQVANEMGDNLINKTELARDLQIRENEAKNLKKVLNGIKDNGLKD